MRQLAIVKLSGSTIDSDAIAKIILARQYNVPQWLFAAYEELAKREESILADSSISREKLCKRSEGT